MRESNILWMAFRAFFDACDGFFTNYSWTEEDVESSAKEAGDRLKDLFIGIDVWGRNFYGGGQFNVEEVHILLNSVNILKYFLYMYCLILSCC